MNKLADNKKNSVKQTSKNINKVKVPDESFHKDFKLEQETEKFDVKKILNKPKSKVVDIVKYSIASIFAILSLIFIAILNNFGMLPDKYFGLVILVFVILNIIGVATLMIKNKWIKIITAIMYLLVGCVSVFGIYYINTTNNFIDNTLSKDDGKYEINYYVLSKNKIDKDKLLKETISYYETAIHIEDAINELKKEYEVTGNPIEKMDDVFKSKIFMLDKPTYDIYVEELSAIKADDYNLIYEFTMTFDENEDRKHAEPQTTPIEEETTGVSITEPVTTTTTTTTKKVRSKNFINIYLGAYDFSGIRMDLNKLITLNTRTKEMVITNLNRDGYFYAPKFGKYNSLFSMASYGVTTNMDAIEYAFNTEIDYYITLKTDGMVELVDSIGGIEYCSDQEYVTNHALVLGTYDDTKGEHLQVVKGCQHLNGIETLTVARERVAFSIGSYQRDKNTTAILEDILDQVKSPSILVRYGDVLSSFSNICKTSIPKDVLQDIVKSLLDSKWSIRTQNISGRNGYDKIGFSDGINWVEYPDKSSIAQAASVIESLNK